MLSFCFDSSPKYAVNAIRKKLYHPNPHVSLSALSVLESCVKNCGSLFHMELATRPVMEDMHELAKITSNEKLKNKILEQIQLWAHAFRNDTSCRAVTDTMNLMKAEGFKFPVLKESDAMFTAETAPQWAEGDCCHRCRVTFGLVNRKHHCRCCGQIFCDKCSARTSAIPKYGIEKDVRVCDDCYDKLNKTTPMTVSKPVLVDAPASSPAPKASAPAGKSEQELREEEELQLAIALSKSEAETREKGPRRSASLSSQPVTKAVRENGFRPADPVPSDPVAEKERERYLNREYWEQKTWEQSRNTRRSSSPAPSAPTPAPVLSAAAVSATQVTENVNHTAAPDTDDHIAELTTFTSNLRKTLDIFKNRMDANKVRYRPISNDSAVQSLFLNVTNMHSQLIKLMQDEEEKRLQYEVLQDKLSDISVARGALDLLREEHREQKRREAEAQEAVRQQQMAQKLDIMRKQKQEYLQYQRQIALQRVQDQEREMLMRKEQHKYAGPPQQSQWPQPLPQPTFYPPSHPLPEQPPPHQPAGHFIPSSFPPQYPPAGTYVMVPQQQPPQQMQQPQPQYQPPPPEQPKPEEPLITFD